MKKSAVAIPQCVDAPVSSAAEVKRTSGIHLVTPATRRVQAAPVAPELSAPVISSRRSQSNRESETVSTLSLAGAALAAPAVWLGHALLAWIERK